MPRIVTLTITDDEVAALASATELAQREPATAWHGELASLLGKLERRAAGHTSSTKPTSALLAEHAPEIDAELARRRSSSSPAHGGSL